MLNEDVQQTVGGVGGDIHGWDRVGLEGIGV